MRVSDSLKGYILRERDQRQWNNADLARALEVNETTVGRLFSGRTKSLSDETAMKLAEVFGLPFNDLVQIAANEQPSVVREKPPRYEDRYDKLARFLREQDAPELDRVIFAVAKEYGMEDEP